MLSKIFIFQMTELIVLIKFLFTLIYLCTHVFFRAKNKGHVLITTAIEHVLTEIPLHQNLTPTIHSFIFLKCTVLWVQMSIDYKYNFAFQLLEMLSRGEQTYEADKQQFSQSLQQTENIVAQEACAPYSNVWTWPWIGHFSSGKKNFGRQHWTV